MQKYLSGYENIKGMYECPQVFYVHFTHIYIDKQIYTSRL